VTHGPWQVRYTRQAEKDLGRLDPPIRRRIVLALDSLAVGDAAGVVRLRGTAADYRLRVGGCWRVIFRRDHDQLIVLVIRILPRGRAYDR
jgi:mRNA interferase RelE/StbE